MAKVNFIKQDVLLQILKKNLTLHESIYKKAQKAFKQNYIKTLAKLSKSARKDKFTLSLNLHLPENHENDYKAAIKMVELSSREEIQLTEDEFMQYVMNQWNWLSSFRYSYYSNVSSSSSSSSPSLSSDEEAYLQDE